MDQRAIGRKIRELRTKMGLTGTMLAKRVRMSQAQASRLESGLQAFRSATLLKFARVLGVPPIYFLVEGKDTSTSKVAEELEGQGLTSSRELRKALTNPAFLKFAEKCARAFKAHKKNLLRMEKAVSRARR